MRISFLVHPLSWLSPEEAEKRFKPMLSKYTAEDNISFLDKPEGEGDIMIALHYPRLIPEQALTLHKHNINIHAADLPTGRGRSPIHWQVEEGKNEIVISLFEIAAGADDGDIYHKSIFRLEGHELLEEIRDKVIAKEIEMIEYFLANYPLEANKQVGEPSYYEKRGPECQKIDPDLSIREQFNQFRVADNSKYPIWFELDGHKYVLKIEEKNKN
ncbi:formyltransferase family protein [Desulfovibrio sp. JC010]|uniref:formyltransferase family protein n=1 Tax=Desulfovibrio sp. JC010 TaxID=2593641 RepID=UPI0013D5B28C|nr:formyltransferase family protein [Desulfovibrio sp. JC010]NDV27163.1 methionyl-tRNA formyltransferase [Desulfovibrio sp. JC010]